MALKLIYYMFAKLLSWMVLHARSDTANEIEILVGFRNSAMVSDQGFHQPGLDMVPHRLDLVAQV